jgi:translation initiation factor 2B subunit (eIF-2B alpha/beta/delta family)
MAVKTKNPFSQLFRELEVETGAMDMAILVFNALSQSVNSFKAKNAEEFCSQFETLVKSVSSTEPKFGILNYNFTNLLKEFKKRISTKRFSRKKWQAYAIREIEKVTKNIKSHERDLVIFSENIDVEGKTILIHDHSHTVQDVLAHFKYLKKQFKVIIAEQDFDKTHSNIERMHSAGIPFQVVPAYMLSHIHDRVDMAFFGAVTLKDTMDFVMDPGTYGIISEMHLNKIPIYMFIDINKFSLWESRERSGIFIYKHKRKHHFKPIEYDRIKYSHDRVPSKLFHHIVTNRGFFTPAEVKKLFQKRFKEVRDGVQRD